MNIVYALINKFKNRPFVDSIEVTVDLDISVCRDKIIHIGFFLFFNYKVSM